MHSSSSHRTLLFFILSTVLALHVHGWSLKVINKVNPCAGRNYCTLKLFTANWGQADLCKDQVRVLDGSQIPPTGLGIQENGMYCRCCGNEGGCINPDNAGMQLVINNGNCHSYQLNDPFYCGKHPPNAKNVVNVQMGGQWPNCEVTLTRKGNAPGCNNSC